MADLQQPQQGQHGGWGWSWSKINVLASPETPVLNSRMRRVSEEREGLIGEGCWELRAGQQGRSGRRKDEVKENTDGSLKSGRETAASLHRRYFIPNSSGGSLNLMGLNRIN